LPHGEALPLLNLCGPGLAGACRSASRLLEAPNWATLYLALFTDDRFRLEVGLADVRAARHYSRRGLIEDVHATSVRGWALNPEQLGQRAPAELWIDHDFVAAVVPGLFRRDLQDRYGGDGCVGFSIAVPPAFEGRSAMFQLRDGAGRVTRFWKVGHLDLEQTIPTSGEFEAGLRSPLGGDVPLSFHPAATRVLGLVTPRSVG